MCLCVIFKVCCYVVFRLNACFCFVVCLFFERVGVEDFVFVFCFCVGVDC